MSSAPDIAISSVREVVGDPAVGLDRVVACPANELLALGQQRPARERGHGVARLHGGRQTVDLPIGGIERVVGVEGVPVVHVRIQRGARRKNRVSLEGVEPVGVRESQPAGCAQRRGNRFVSFLTRLAAPTPMMHAKQAWQVLLLATKIKDCFLLRAQQVTDSTVTRTRETRKHTNIFGVL